MNSNKTNSITKRENLINCIMTLSENLSIDTQEFINYAEKRLSTEEEDYKSVFPETQDLIVSGDKKYVSNLKVLLAQNLYSNSGKIIEIKDQLSRKLEIPQPPIGWYISEKYDGIRAIWDGEKFISRGSSSGKPKVYTYVPDFITELMPPGIALDGEMWIERGKFGMVSGLSNLKPVEKSKGKTKKDIDKYWRGNGNPKLAVKYKVYDMPSSNKPFEERMEFLQQVIKDRQELWRLFLDDSAECPLQFTEQTKVESIDQLYDTYKSLTSQGAEGVMLRAPNSPYETKRSKYLLKYKIKDDAEAVVRGYVFGTGRLKGLLGSLKCELIKGNIPSKIYFNIGTGFSDIQRTEYNDTESEYFIPLDSVVSFSYMELTEDSVPRHPVYRGLRQDFYFEKEITKEITKEVIEGEIKEEKDFKQIIIQSFNILIKNEEIKKESNWQFKKKAYVNVVSAFKNSENEVNNVKDALDILRVAGQKFPGEEANFAKNSEYKSKVINKIHEIITSGKLTSAEKYAEDPKVKSITELTRIPEIGPSAAEKLYSEGIKTIADLKAAYSKDKTIINDKQSIGLEHYEDLEKRIQRTEMDIWNKQLTEQFEKSIKELNDKSKTESTKIMNAKIEMVGSYRRGQEDSGDIDILISCDNVGSTIQKKIMNKFLENLFRKDLLNEELVFAQGPTKFMGLGKINEYYRHIDIFYYSHKEYPFALLFSTGSGPFNVEMRAYAIKEGYSLSDKGLKKLNEKGKSAEEVSDAEYSSKIGRIPENEKDIFDFLELEYVEPKDRTTGKIKKKMFKVHIVNN